MIYLLLDLIFKSYFGLNTYFVLFLPFKRSLFEIIIVGLIIDLIILHTYYITFLLIIFYLILKYIFKFSKSVCSYFLYLILVYLIFVNINIEVKSTFFFFISCILMYLIEWFIIKFFSDKYENKCK